ncbi:MAG: O-antigen ligase family protein [Desulfovibrionaceae bacterium]|nr:O-antigen ligase family protein [Desulfovibrionaceae bacterium]
MEEVKAEGQGRKASFVQKMRELKDRDPGEFWHSCLFWTFWFHLAFYIIGYGFREVMPLICAIFLALYYRSAWKKTVLSRLPVWPLFICLYVMLLIGIVFSMNPWASFLEVGTALNKGLLLPFLGMECVRSLKDLKRLTLAACLAVFWVGLDGIYQSVYGIDFVMGYAAHCGRLTAVMDDYEIGNYLSLVFVPAFGLWYIAREKFSPAVSFVILLLVFGPGFYTLAGSAVRSAMLALTVSAIAWVLCHRSRKSLILVVAIILAVGIAVLVMQHQDVSRFNYGDVAKDGRWSLWKLAWSVFWENPVFGAGIDMYNTAFRALGLIPEYDVITISHPHNMYLDILYSTGVVGALFGATFLFGMLLWQAWHIVPHIGGTWQPPLEGENDRPGQSRLYWQLAGLFALAWVTWLADAVFGHELLRMWWFGHAMLSLGVSIGAIVRGTEEENKAGDL